VEVAAVHEVVHVVGIGPVVDDVRRVRRGERADIGAARGRARIVTERVDAEDDDASEDAEHDHHDHQLDEREPGVDAPRAVRARTPIPHVGLYRQLRLRLEGAR